MKLACIIYHKNARKLYPDKWIQQCISSILNQTYSRFDIFELDYGGNGERLVTETNPNIGYTHINRECVNFVDGMNQLLDMVFVTGKYDACFNVNLDDYYAHNRFEKQVEAIQWGFDLISSDIVYVDEQSEIKRFMRFSHLPYKKEIQRGNNVIAHPAVCYTRKFWLGCPKYDINAIPLEDMLLWKRTMFRFKFHIIQEFLCFHRIHENKVCQNPNNR